MNEVKNINLFSFIIRKINKGINPPYYYPSIINFSENNLSEIKSKICNQLQEVFKLQDTDVLKELKKFIDNLSENKCKLEFEQFILRTYIIKNKIYLCVDTDIDINKLE